MLLWFIGSQNQRTADPLLLSHSRYTHQLIIVWIHYCIKLHWISGIRLNSFLQLHWIVLQLHWIVLQLHWIVLQLHWIVLQLHWIACNFIELFCNSKCGVNLLHCSHTLMQHASTWWEAGWYMTELRPLFYFSYSKATCKHLVGCPTNKTRYLCRADWRCVILTTDLEPEHYG